MHHLPSRYIPCDGRLTSSAYFNPHSPHGERQSSSLLCVVLHYISIHAPRMESDFVVYDCQTGFTKFQSTLPAWGATRPCQGASGIYRNFNPRSPHGERPNSFNHLIINRLFQSTLPAWGATGFWYTRKERRSYFNPRSPHGERLFGLSTVTSNVISIHAPRMGSDLKREKENHQYRRFQSTLPAWGATFLATSI